MQSGTDGQPIRRGRGRPPGLYGSSLLRRAIRLSLEQDREETAASSVVGAGRPRRLQSTEGQQAVVVPEDVRIDSPNPLQQLVLLHARSQSQAQQDEGIVNPAEEILCAGRRRLLSEVASGGLYNNADVRKVASTLIQASAALWSMLLEHILGLLESGWTGLALTIFRRYDETPLFLRVDEEEKTEETQQHDSLLLSTGKGSGVCKQGKKSCKIMQSEAKLSAVLKHTRTGKVVQLQGKVPTFLQTLETTKAEQIARSQTEILNTALPDLNSLGAYFVLKNFVSCTDRCSANLKAERHIQAKHPGWVLTHNTCTVHKLSGVEKAMSDITPGHIGGMIAIGMAMRNAGTMQELRKHLMTILDKELCVIIGNPKAQQHRTAIYDLLLPISRSDAVCTEVNSKSKKTNVSLANHRRRLILNHFLNGDISEEHRITHYTAVARDRSEILAEMKTHLLPALLPKACPILNRSKWLGCELTFQYLGLLLSHHGLLTKLMISWKGSANNSVASDQVDEGPSLGPGLGRQWAASWGKIAGSLGQNNFPSSSGDGDDGSFMDDDDDDEFTPQPIFDPISGDVNWQEQNRATIQKAVSWAESKPCSSVLIMCIAWQPILKLMQRLIYIGSEEFEQQQRAETMAQRPRTYKILELYLGNHTNQFFTAVNSLLHSVPGPLPPNAWTSFNRTLLFRLLSRSACAVHQMFSARCKGAPYVLFSALWGLSDAQRVPECMRDQLTQFFADHYSGDKLFEPDAQCLLAAIAGLADQDIVGIEVRHASTRRISALRSCQTHAMAFEDLGAEFVCRQQVILREHSQRHLGTGTPTIKSSSAKMDKKKGKMVRRKARVSRGGAWRAFVHFNFQGRKLTPNLWQEAANDYNTIKSKGGPEYEFYQNLGMLGTLAGRKGHKAYKKFVPGGKVDTDAIVPVSPLQSLLEELNRLVLKNRNEKTAADAWANEQLVQRREASKNAKDLLSTTCGLRPSTLLDSTTDASHAGSYPPAFVALPGSLNSPWGLEFYVPAEVIAVVSCHSVLLVGGAFVSTHMSYVICVI